jgi:TolB protein
MKLAFGAAPGSGDPSILIAAVDGTGPVPLAGAAGAIDPAWSPDGRRIAFLALDTNRKPALFVIPSSGGTATKISRSEIDASGTDDDFAEPAWSPDGTRVATHAVAGATTDIVVVAADGSDERFPLRSNVPDSWPSWSPDGKELAFIGGGAGFPASISVVTVDSIDWRTRTLSMADPAGSPVSWSPDGTQLLGEICQGTDCATQSLAIIDPLDVRPPIVIKTTEGPSPQNPGYTASTWQRLAP